MLPNIIIFTLALDPSEELDQVQIAREIRNGNHRAFRTFFNAHYDQLFRFLVSRGVSKATAEDLIQKAFVIIWEKRDTIDESKSLRAYLFRIAYTRMLNHFRDNKKFDSGEGVPDESSNLTPADNLQEKQLLEAVDRAVEAMPEKRRMVFEFCFLQEFTYKEAANALDVSVKTVENHMGLAFKDIRKALDIYNR